MMLPYKLQLRALLSLALLNILFLPLAQAQQTQIDAALPAIICLLLCQEEPTSTAPDLQDMDAVTLFQNVPIVALVFTNNGGREISDCSLMPDLPAGLTLRVRNGNTSCEIVGTPTELQAATDYSVTAVNAFGDSQATLSIEVRPSLPELADIVGDVILFEDVSASPIVFSNSGGTGIISCTADPALPGGLLATVSADESSCEISGTPNAISAAADFQITASNQFGSDSGTINIEVQPSLPVLDNIAGLQTFFRTLQIDPVRFSNSGGANISGCTVSPPLPVGLSVQITADTKSCEIVGTPQADTPATNYTITASNNFGDDMATVELEVLPPEPVLEDISGTLTLFTDTAVGDVVFVNNGGGDISSCQISPALPSALTIEISEGLASCRLVGTPDAALSETLFTVTATNAFGNDDATVSLEVLDGPVLTGRITFDLVPTTTSGGVRLDYNNISAEPVRGATVQLLDVSNSVLQSATTDSNGDYMFTLATDQSVRVRVRAELLKDSGASRYDVKIIDNTNQGALYTLAEPLASNVSSNPSRNLHAISGWDGNAYSATRAAAPFAMLDNIYSAITDILAVDSDAVFPPLNVNWSVNNRTESGNISSGAIGTSFYTNGNLFILGAANNDTDEYDDHIIIHEWGHYFEDNLSRSDSIGGPHSGNDRLDMRLAFGEGFGNALSGIITDDPLYVDTRGVDQSSGFVINVENNPAGSNRGWYNESSVQSILYDLYDADDDGADAITMGLAPLYEVLINEQRSSPFFTSIFTFITALKNANPASVAAIDAVVGAQAISSVSIDERGSMEQNDAAGTPHVLPVYTQLTVGQTTNICTNTEFNGASDNKLGNHRYLNFTVTQGGQYTVRMERTSAPANYGNSDPDFIIDREGVRINTGFSPLANVEETSPFLAPGDYVMAASDFNIGGTNARGIACFDIDINPASP